MDDSLPMYDASMKSQDWMNLQATAASSAATLFDGHVGPEAHVFADAMALLHSCLTEELPSRMESLGRKVATAILSQAYQQLISAWEDARFGRDASATSHWRSIWEAFEFATAAALNDDFARTWADRDRRETLNVERARRIVRRFFDESEDGLGAAVAARRAEEQAHFQAFSHVSPAAAGQTAFKPDPDASGFFLLPEGAFTPRSREVAIYTADLARRLCAAAYLSFQSDLPRWWIDLFVKVFDSGRDTLNSEFAASVATRDRKAGSR